MDLAEIRKLVKLVETSNISELEIEEGESRVRISKHIETDRSSSFHPPLYSSYPLPVPPPGQPTAPFPTVPAEQTLPTEPHPAVAAPAKIVEVTSPMVGTFYQAPSPEAPPYVQLGDMVKPGQVLCIIEAMKLMNEIESEVSGKIIHIAAENAVPVEFGQLLFKIQLIK